MYLYRLIWRSVQTYMEIEWLETDTNAEKLPASFTAIYWAKLLDVSFLATLEKKLVCQNMKV